MRDPYDLPESFWVKWIIAGVLFAIFLILKFLGVIKT